MAYSELLQIDNKEQWLAAVERCRDYDTYHLPGYHWTAKENGEGEPYLFLLEHHGEFAAFPFLLRPIKDLPGIPESSYFDATSVYGYAGPITSLDNRDEEFKRRFQEGLLEQLSELDIVSFFSRLNPLFQTDWLLEGLGDTVEVGPTVSIDLSNSKAEISRQMSTNHRRDMRKARHSGVAVIEDRKWDYLESFIESYYQTMSRKKAEKYYFFAEDYYHSLRRSLNDSARLFVAQSESNEIVSSAIIFATGTTLQYHLGATPTKHLGISALKLILEEVTFWGKSNGYRRFHLGGGLGAVEDSLFRFKAGFSGARHEFKIYKLIISKERYIELVRKRNDDSRHDRVSDDTASYFPEYRQP